MRPFLLCIFSFFCVYITAQSVSNELWVTAGTKIPLNKTLLVGVDLTQRYGTYGLETFFPQVSFRYKVNKWFKPSVDYRLIGSRDVDAPMVFSHRINGNLQFNWNKERLSAGFRARYQYSLEPKGGVSDAEFDKAIRLKPSIAYDIENFPLSPSLSAEIFYSLNQGSRGANRIRYFLGFDVDLKRQHAIDFGLMTDQWINNVPRWRFMYCLGYTYTFKRNSDEKGGSKNMRDL